jgi:hypothetical protein
LIPEPTSMSSTRGHRKSRLRHQVESLYAESASSFCNVDALVAAGTDTHTFRVAFKKRDKRPSLVGRGTGPRSHQARRQSTA